MHASVLAADMDVVMGVVILVMRGAEEAST